MEEGSGAKCRRFSFIVPACNEEDYLPLTIRNLRELQREEGIDVEIVVSVNGSTDRTLEIARNMADKVVIDQEHRGVSSARNLGASAADGEIFVFLDADARPLGGSLRAIDQAMHSPRNVGTCRAQPDSGGWKARIWVAIKNFIRSSGTNKGASELIFCHRSLFYHHGVQFDDRRNIGEISDFFSRAERLAGARYVYLKHAQYLTCLRRQRRIGYLKTVLFWVRSWIFTGAFRRDFSTLQTEYWRMRY